MSCWVVPTIAAEYWGVSVDSILHRIREGSLAHRVDEGFVFVQVAPSAPKIEHPPTFTALSEAELDALRDEADDKANGEEASQPIEPEPIAPQAEAPIEEEESQSPDDDEASTDLGDWRSARRRAGMKRVPPPRSRAAAA